MLERTVLTTAARVETTNCNNAFVCMRLNLQIANNKKVSKLLRACAASSLWRRAWGAKHLASAFSFRRRRLTQGNTAPPASQKVL